MLRPARASARFACATASACCATATDGCCDSAELTAAWRVTGTWASAGPADVATTASDMTRIKTRRVHTFTRPSPFTNTNLPPGPVLTLSPALEQDVEDGNQEQRQEGRYGQASDDSSRQRRVRLTPLAQAQRHGDHPEDRGQRRHQDRPQPHASGLHHGVVGGQAAVLQTVGVVYQHEAGAHAHPYPREH